MSGDGGYTSDDVWLCMKCGTALETHCKNQAQLLEAAAGVVALAFGDGDYGCCRRDWGCFFERPSCGFGMDDDCPFCKLKDAVEKAKGGQNEST